MPDLLTPKQLAEYLQLSQRTIYRLLDRDQIPAFKVGGQWRFRKSAVDYWLDLRMHQLESAHLQEMQAGAVEPALSLGAVLREENALIAVPAGAVSDVVQALVSRVTFPERVDADLVVQRVMEREALCSTASPEGVALLHTARWEPRVLAAHDLLAVGRLSEPIDFGALDGGRTDVLFLILARNERDHLVLLAKVARLCREPAFVDGLREARAAADVVALVEATERRVFGSRWA
jgi:PTS system nitrogen regulatory IIA component